MSQASDDKNKYRKINIIPPAERPGFLNQWKDLLLKAFPSSNKIEVIKSLSGYSDERTWDVSTQEGPTTGRFVAKIGKPKRIKKEKENSDSLTGQRFYGYQNGPLAACRREGKAKL